MTDSIILPPNSKAIPLTHGKFTIVDEVDYENLSANKWKFDSNGYVARSVFIGRINGITKTKTILMHRLIMNTPKGMDTDHINGNKLDNRRSNLRVCTTSQNCSNQHRRTNAKNNYRGVHWHKKLGKWQAKIVVNYKQIYLGVFENELDAAKTYNNAAIKHHGEFARLNHILRHGHAARENHCIGKSDRV